MEVKESKVYSAEDWFSKAPFDFIKKHLVNPAFKDAINKVYEPNNLMFATYFTSVLDSGFLPIQAFRIKQVRVSQYLNYTLCPALDYYLNYNNGKWKFNAAYLNILKEGYQDSYIDEVRLAAKFYAKAEGALTKLCENINSKNITVKNWFSKEPVILGYYFPYKNGLVKNKDGKSKEEQLQQIESEMGYVDIPKANPRYHFVFTGQMNGCYIVVSESRIEEHYRAWHYQSPTNNSQHTAVYKSDDFPKEVRAWLSYNDYAGTHENEIAAFNFLYYDDPQKKWFVCSQPHQVIRPPSEDPQKLQGLEEDWKIWRAYMAKLSSKQPFIRPINLSSSNNISRDRCAFPRPFGLNYAFSEEPILLNGMKVLFDNPAPTSPVTLQPKQSGTNNGR